MPREAIPSTESQVSAVVLCLVMQRPKMLLLDVYLMLFFVRYSDLYMVHIVSYALS